MSDVLERPETKTSVGGIAADRLRSLFPFTPSRAVTNRPTQNPLTRFAAKIEPKASGCFEWRASLSKEGYGWFSWESKAILAHRWAFEASRGPIPAGMVIDHLCRNRKCVNPHHLECVQMSENTRRGVLHDLQRAKAKEQTHCKNGHPLFGENLLMTSSGHRSCRTCQRTNARQWKINNREHINRLQRIRRGGAP